MDEKDQRLLALLQSNARESTASLARKLSLSRSTVQERIARLERRGIIEGYTIRLNEAFERRLIRAYVMITAAPRESSRIYRGLGRLPQVRELYSVSGPSDYVAVLVSETTEALDEVLHQIRQIDGIEDTTTSILLSGQVIR